MVAMRLSICTAAVAFLANSIAAPTTTLGARLYRPHEGKIGRRSPPDNPDVTKYFHEPGGDNTLGHYSSDYFHGIVSDEERVDTQSHMIRAYLAFFREKELDTWIAHGTLLGWWWNGKRLPWDFDLDTQVSVATLHHLGEAHNQTRYQYTSPDGKTKREYLLDVNPWIWQRERGDGMNIIDARWIDVRNGLFIDITGLAETHPDTAPGIWSCKNYHRYKTSEIYPMRETMFEGVPAKVPYSYGEILLAEYHESALVNTNFNGHVWSKDKREWVKTPETLAIEEQARKAKEQEKKAKEEEKKAKDNNESEEMKKAIERVVG